MILSLTDPTGAPWNEEALRALGAVAIAPHPRDEEHTGTEVHPDLPLDKSGAPKGYAAAASSAKGGALVAYAEAKHAAVRDGGIVVDVGDGAKADVSSDSNGRGLVNGCIGLADLATKMQAPAPTFPWINNDGTKLTLSVAQMETIALALGQFVQAVYGALGDVLAGIASGDIADEAAIDAAAWPKNGA